MRIDLYLKVTGLLKTRSIAGKAISSGSVVLDGRKAKASSAVLPGSVIDLVKPDGTSVTVEVLEIPKGKNVSRAARKELYRVVSEEDDCL